MHGIEPLVTNAEFSNAALAMKMVSSIDAIEIRPSIRYPCWQGIPAKEGMSLSDIR